MTSHSRHTHWSSAQQELQEAVKRSAQRRRPIPGLSVRTSPSPRDSKREDERYDHDSSLGMIAERMADRSPYPVKARPSLSSVLAQAAASEMEKIRNEDRAIYDTAHTPDGLLFESPDPVSNQSLGTPTRTFSRLLPGSMRTPNQAPSSSKLTKSVVSLLPEPSSESRENSQLFFSANHTASGRTAPVVAYPLTGPLKSVEMSQRHFARLEAQLHQGMAQAGEMLQDGVILETMFNRTMDSEVTMLRRLCADLRIQVGRSQRGYFYGARRVAFERWIRAHGVKGRRERLVQVRMMAADVRRKVGALRFWRVGRSLGRIAGAARAAAR